MEEPPNTDNKNGAEKDNQLVEVVVETQAEVGASGYSVVGGGERGIFIQEVLRDSPAAKHLSLQKGDQLLSARVYFDNVKYEDALKILQCAEPYKVSFFLKRTVPGSEVSIRPGAQSLELRGPKAKMQRMSVKSVKPFKAKKRRGGRFGLKRLKENKKAKARAELDIEGSPAKSELSPVDVEFVFPKFKMSKGGRATADVSGHLEGGIASSKKKKKIILPKIKATDAAVGEGNVNVDVATHEGEASGTKMKVKVKGPKFGMNFPKLKKSKLDVQSSNDSFEVKGLEAKIKPPSVECDLNMPQGKAETNVPNLEVSVKGKGQGPEIKMPKMNLDVSDTKMTIPKFKMPKVRLSCHSDEIDGEASKQIDTYESKLKTPKIDIKAPNVDLDLNLSKTKGMAEFKDAEKINTAKLDTSLPKLNLDAKLGDDIDGSMVKEHRISLPKLDIAVPKIETSDVDMDLPTLDVTLPKMAAKNIDTERHASTGVKYEVTKLDISLPKITSPEGEMIVVEPEAKTGKFHKTNIIISLPKGKAEGKVEGHTKKGAKVDISLPKETLEGGADIEGQFGKGGKFKMPSVGVSLPNVKLPEHAITEGPEIKAGKLSEPSIEISLPKGKTEGNVEVGEPSGKGGKFKMPPLDASLPKMKLSTGKINTEDPEVKGEKFQMPSVAISLPKGKVKAGVEVEGHSGKAEIPKIDQKMPLLEGKIISESHEVSISGVDISLPKGKPHEHINLEVEHGDKFQIPKFDISLPKLKSGECDIDVKRPNTKVGKFNMPEIDISLPHKKDERDINVEPSGKCERVDISLPAVKTSGEISLPKTKSSQGDISFEGPDSKTFNMPSVDVSFPKVTGTGDVDVDVKRHSGKIGKFDMPKLVINLPQMKSTDTKINMETPEVKGGDFPDVDISLPQGKVKGDGTIKKGGKFKMPKIDLSLPRIKSKPVQVNVEGPKSKGSTVHTPSIDISLPKSKAETDIDIKGNSGTDIKFEMPKIDNSLPKVKVPEGKMRAEAPQIPGGKLNIPSIEMSFPKGKAKGHTDLEGKTTGASKGGKVHMPSIDISLPGGGVGGDVDVEGQTEKGGKFEMATVDVSLPKLKVPGGEIDIEGPDIKGGKIHMPSIDISLPRVGAGGDVDVEGHAGKGRKFEMPKFDVSLPKLKPSGGEIDFEGPDIKGGKFHMPSINISLPRGGAGGDVDVEGHKGKGRKFEMPKVDVSLPKLKPSGGEINVEGPDVKGGKVHMPSIDISLPGTTDSNAKIKATTGAKISDSNVPEATLSGNIKLPTVKIPTVDISAPKVDLDFTLPKAKGCDRDNIELLKAEGGRPSSGASFDIPDVSVKMPKISLPKFGRKLKSGDKLELESPGLSIGLDIEKTSPSMGTGAKMNKSKIKMPSIGTSKQHIEITGPEAEMKIKADAGEMTKPDIKVEEPDDKVRYKLKFPKFKTTTPKAKLKDVELDMPAMDNKGKVKIPAVEISLPTANIPECEVLLPKTEVDVSEADIRGYEGSLKIPKMPTIGISVPKVDLDVSLPRVKHKPEDSKSSDLNIDSNRGMVNFPHVKIPKVDLSLPHGKTGDTGIHEVEIGKRGKLRMPEVEISLPHVKNDTSNADIEIKGETISVPNVDISLPRGKTKETDYPDSEFGAKGSKLKMPDITVPKIDLSLPRGSKGESHAPDSELEGGKLKMPTVDISLPKIKSKDVAPELQPGEGKGKVTIPGIKLPTVDISLPHGKIEDIDTLELGACGKEGKFKSPNIKIPKVDISLEGQQENTEKKEVRKQGGNFQLPKITMPKVDLSLPYGKTGDTEASGSVEVKGGQHKMPDIKIPQVDISLPKGKTGEFDTKEVESGGGGGKFTMSNVKIPKVDIVMSSDADMSVPSTDAGLKDAHKEGKKMRMPTTHIEGPNLDLELDLGLSKKGKKNKKNKKKTELPEIDLSSTAPKEKIKGTKVKGSKFNIGMPKVKVSGLETDITKPGKKDATFIKGGTDANLTADLPAPKIPELDFDIETAKVDTNHSEEDKKQTGKVKIPKFGIPLPSLSSPEVNITSSQVKGHSINVDSEVEYEGPRMPKVTKAVFVMVNRQSESAASVGGEASAEIGDEKLKLPKIKMKSSSGKSRSNEKGNAVNLEQEVETEGKSKTGKLKLPKVTFSSGQRGSFDVTPSGSDDGTSLNSDKEEKAMFGKLKLPKLEFFSPYSKETVQAEEMETSMTRLRKETSGESKESKETKTISGTVRETDTLVYSKARTEMLAEREGSESPTATVSSAFVSVKKSEERQETTCFKVPKFTLSPHSTGILHITPESSPKGSKSSLHCSSEEASGGFYVKMPSVEYLTHEMSSEHLITKTEGTLTVVTKTTKYTETKSSSSKQ
ncbi:hypothetical protein PO909_032754 [Leuciscus waleckii]